MISIGVDCLKLKKGQPIDDSVLLENTKIALRKYNDNHHSAAIALTSTLALIHAGRDIPTVREHIVEIIKEIEDANYSS